jgi:hypothetical protein
MPEIDSHIEKRFELWPGVLRLMAAGPGAHAAIDRGMDAARAVASTLMVDAELIARGSADVLPRGIAARHALEAARGIAQVVGDQVPALFALPGAVCDFVLHAMRGAGPIDVAVVALGDALAFHLEGGAGFPMLPSMPLVSGEFARALGSSTEGGIALAGLSSAFPTSGVADHVVVQGKSAALAALAASSISDSVTVAERKPRRARIADPLVALAWKGRDAAGSAGLVAADEIWAALSKAMRRASALREKRLLRAAAFALKGRGRTLGPVDGDRLLRFGVSEWR